MSAHAIAQAWNHPAAQASMLSIAGLSVGHVIPVLAALAPIVYYSLSAIFLVVDRFKPKSPNSTQEKSDGK